MDRFLSHNTNIEDTFCQDFVGVSDLCFHFSEAQELASDVEEKIPIIGISFKPDVTEIQQYFVVLLITLMNKKSRL